LACNRTQKPGGWGLVAVPGLGVDRKGREGLETKNACRGATPCKPKGNARPA